MKEYDRLRDDRERQKKELKNTQKSEALKLLRMRKLIKSQTKPPVQKKIPWYKRVAASAKRKMKRLFYKFLNLFT